MASPWASPEELRKHLRLPAIDEDQAVVDIAAAETVIRGELEQTIDAVADEETVLVGNGRTVINLPEMPVTAVASVTEAGQLLAEGADYRWNRYGILTRIGACWPLDADITVVDSHGYTPIPPIVKQVCLQVAGRIWTHRTTAIAAESLGDRSVTYDKDRTGEALTEYERRLLSRYARGNQSR